MNKKELVESISEKAELSKVDAEKALKAFIESVKGSLAEGEKVSLVGFGTFEVRDTAEREVQANPRYPEAGKKILPAGKKPAFKASKVFKEIVNK